MLRGARRCIFIPASGSRAISTPNFRTASRCRKTCRFPIAMRYGAARLLYFDRQYSDTLRLDASGCARGLPGVELAGIRFEHTRDTVARPLLDLAVSKLARFSSQDSDDIVSLARHKLIDSKKLRQAGGRGSRCLRRGAREGRRDRSILPAALLRTWRSGDGKASFVVRSASLVMASPSRSYPLRAIANC